MIAVPEMIRSIIGVYNGKAFNQVEIKLSYKPVRHGRPSIGVTHFSRSILLYLSKEELLLFLVAFLLPNEPLKVPITVHFDHGASKQELVEAFDLGFHSIMVDGSHLSYEDNISYTKFISRLAHLKDMMVEGELGRSGTEDDLTVEDYEAKLTDINQAEEFIDRTGIDALAVCIGNLHGKYPASGPNLRLDLLKDLHDLLKRVV